MMTVVPSGQASDTVATSPMPDEDQREWMTGFWLSGNQEIFDSTWEPTQ
jgi:hypothetical protein